MASCATCGTNVTVGLCPHCKDSFAATRRQLNRVLQKYSYPMIVGLIGIVFANGYFPVLDRNAYLGAGLCAVFAPIVFHLVSSVRKRLALDLQRLQRAYLAAGAATVFLALLIACNGGLDQSAATLVSTSLIYKQVVRGKSGASYTLRVRSWRPGRATEDLGVNARTYRSVSTDKGVVVEIHRGALGIPWCSGVHSE